MNEERGAEKKESSAYLCFRGPFGGKENKVMLRGSRNGEGISSSFGRRGGTVMEETNGSFWGC